MKHTLLIIDDEPDLVDLLKEELQDQYRIELAFDAPAALKVIAQSTIDLVLLDLHIPNGSGLELCREFRQSVYAKEVPIFILTGESDEETQLQCFANGADDFIQKPFNLSVLKARIAARLKNSNSQKAGIFRCGNLELHKEAKMITVAGKNLQFSPVEFRIVAYLVENPFRVVPRQEMLNNIWGGADIAARTIDAHLVPIRKALVQSDHEIVSLYGEGYSLRKRNNGKR